MNLDNLVNHLEEQLDALADGLVYYPIVCEGECVGPQCLDCSLRVPKDPPA